MKTKAKKEMEYNREFEAGHDAGWECGYTEGAIQARKELWITVKKILDMNQAEISECLEREIVNFKDVVDMPVEDVLSCFKTYEQKHCMQVLTNGDKFKEIFGFSLNGTLGKGFICFTNNGSVVFSATEEWLNTEYKEPEK